MLPFFSFFDCLSLNCPGIVYQRFFSSPILPGFPVLNCEHRTQKMEKQGRLLGCVMVALQADISSVIYLVEISQIFPPGKKYRNPPKLLFFAHINLVKMHFGLGFSTI